MQGEARLKKDAVDRSSKGPATGELEKIDESFGERPSADNMTREQRGDNHCVCNSSTTGDDREATNSDQAQIRDQTATDREVGAYRGSSQGHLGSLCVSFQGVSFKTVMRSKVRWSLKYEELKSIQKVRSRPTRPVQLRQLCFSTPITVQGYYRFMLIVATDGELLTIRFE